MIVYLDWSARRLGGPVTTAEQWHVHANTRNRLVNIVAPDRRPRPTPLEAATPVSRRAVDSCLERASELWRCLPGRKPPAAGGRLAEQRRCAAVEATPVTPGPSARRRPPTNVPERRSQSYFFIIEASTQPLKVTPAWWRLLGSLTPTSVRTPLVRAGGKRFSGQCPWLIARRLCG